MSTNVFLVLSRESTVPLTIFAPSADEAALTFREWAGIHMPASTKEPARSEEVGDQRLAERPQLPEAVERARTNRLHDTVLLFISHEAGWLAVPTFASAIGPIAPPEPAVRCYDVRVEKAPRARRGDGVCP